MLPQPFYSRSLNSQTVSLFYECERSWSLALFSTSLKRHGTAPYCFFSLLSARRPRNLVLSICDFKLQQQTEVRQQVGAGGPPQGALGGIQGRVGSKLFLGRGTQLLLHGGADELGCYSDLHAIELGQGLGFRD